MTPKVTPQGSLRTAIVSPSGRVVGGTIIAAPDSAARATALSTFGTPMNNWTKLWPSGGEGHTRMGDCKGRIRMMSAPGWNISTKNALGYRQVITGEGGINGGVRQHTEMSTAKERLERYVDAVDRDAGHASEQARIRPKRGYSTFQYASQGRSGFGPEWD